MTQLALPIAQSAILQIGHDRIRAEPEIAIMQIGFYVIGESVGRDAKGRFSSVRWIRLPEYTTVDPETMEYISLPSRQPQDRGRAPLATLVAMIAMLVIVQVEQVSRAWAFVCAIGRVIWCAMMGRPGRVYRAKQSWASIWKDGIAQFA